MKYYRHKNTCTVYTSYKKEAGGLASVTTANTPYPYLVWDANIEKSTTPFPMPVVNDYYNLGHHPTMPVRMFLRSTHTTEQYVAGLLDYGYDPAQIAVMLGTKVENINKLITKYNFKLLEI